MIKNIFKLFKFWINKTNWMRWFVVGRANAKFRVRRCLVWGEWMLSPMCLSPQPAEQEQPAPFPPKPKPKPKPIQVSLWFWALSQKYKQLFFFCFHFQKLPSYFDSSNCASVSQARVVSVRNKSAKNLQEKKHVPEKVRLSSSFQLFLTSPISTKKKIVNPWCSHFRAFMKTISLTT